jgi:hypothetical protein
MKTMSIIVILLVVAAAWIWFQSQQLNQSGGSFSYKNGGCAIWYSRKGTTILDVAIVPHTKLRDIFDARSENIITSDGSFPFGASGHAYILDDGHWMSVPIRPLNESRFSRLMPDMQNCSNITQIAEIFTGEKIAK